MQINSITGKAIISSSIVVSMSFAALLCCSCASVPRHAATMDIPFEAQTLTNHCGVAALSMTLDYYGKAYNSTNLEKEVFLPLVNGTPVQLLAEAATRRGLRVRSAELELEHILRQIKSGRVVIIYLKPFEGSIGHFAVVTGISDNLKKVRLHCQQRPNCWIKASRLMKQSSNNRFPALIIAPEENAPASVSDGTRAGGWTGN